MNKFENALNKIDRRYRFLIQAVFSGFIIYFWGTGAFGFEDKKVFFFVLLELVLSIIVVHFPNITPKNILFALVLPLALVIGGKMSFEAYPNLNLYFKIFLTLGFVTLYYMSSLMDNIFLIIHSREEAIPLYRVALTWLVILHVLVAIPLYAAIYRFPYTASLQIVLICLIAVIFNLYQIIATYYDPDAKNVRVGEGIFLLCIAVFLQFSLGLGTLFFPAEPFMRSLLAAAGLLFGLNLNNAHLKNELTKKLLFQYFLIVLLFLILLFFFVP